MQKSWQMARERVDRKPSPDESVFFFNPDTEDDGLGGGDDSDEDGEDDSLGEDGDIEEHDEDTEENHTFHAELQRAKTLAHPLRTVLQVLGVTVDPVFAVLGLALPLDFPRPEAASDIDSFLGQEHIINHVKARREEGEKELVEWWEKGPGLTAGRPSQPHRQGSFKHCCDRQPATQSSLPPSRRHHFLLSITWSFGRARRSLALPSFLSRSELHGFPKDMNSTRMYRRLEAERVTNALLRALGTSDVAYTQLLLMGASSVCGRCDDGQPKTWDQIAGFCPFVIFVISIFLSYLTNRNYRQVDHYCDVTQLWTGLQRRTPEFKAKHPLDFTDVHDLHSVSAPKPFVRRLAPQEVASMTNPPPPSVIKEFCCILCRNYGVCHIFKGPAPTLTHMNDV
ncbi:hypothetical protein FRC10_005642, partial [Ceratobasidium sp. 414]